MQFIFLPTTLEFPSIWPFVNAVTLNLIVHPVPVVLGPISPCVRPFALLFTSFKLADVCGSVFKNFLAFTMLQVVKPITFISLARFMSVSSCTVRFVLLKSSLKHIAVCMIERSLALGLTLTPFSYVAGSIRPSLSAIAVF